MIHSCYKSLSIDERKLNSRVPWSTLKPDSIVPDTIVIQDEANVFFFIFCFFFSTYQLFFSFYHQFNDFIKQSTLPPSSASLSCSRSWKHFSVVTVLPSIFTWWTRFHISRQLRWKRKHRDYCKRKGVCFWRIHWYSMG